jgi:hypothetical protein
MEVVVVYDVNIDLTAAGGKGDSVLYRSKTSANDIELREPQV